MPLFTPGRRVALPSLVAGSYLFPVSTHAIGASGTLGNGTLRLIPWVVEAPMRIDRIGAEITIVGEAGSKSRLGIYADNGAAFPGALLLDAGQIAGDAVAVVDLVCSLTLPAALYWIGGAVQSAATTQPTLRTVANWAPPVSVAVGTTTPAAAQALIGYSQTGVTGALPATFTGGGFAASCARLHVRTA